MDAVEAAKALVDAVNHHLTGGALRVVLNCRAAKDDDRRRGFHHAIRIKAGAQRRLLRLVGPCQQAIGELGLEERRRSDDDVGGAEAAERDLREALANRGTHQQRAGEHGHRHGHAEHHHHVGGGIEPQAGSGQESACGGSRHGSDRQPATVHRPAPVEPGAEGFTVRHHEEHGVLLGVEAEDQVSHDLRGFRIEIAGGFVA